VRAIWSLAIALAALLAVFGGTRLYGEIRGSIRPERGRHGFMLVTSVGLLSILSTTLGDFLMAQYPVDAQYDQVVQVASPWVLQVDRLGVLATFVIGALLGGAAILRPGARLDRVAGLAICIIALGGLASVLNHGPLTSQRQAALVAIVFAAGVVKTRKADVHAAVVIFGIFLVVSSALLFFVHHGQAVSRCRVDKCGPMGVLFNGIFLDENALGLDLVMTLPFVLYGRKRGYLALATAVSFMAIITGSRTAQVALAATVTVFLLGLASARGGAHPRRWPAMVGVLAGAAVGALIPLVAPLNSLSERPLLWQLASGARGLAIAFGHGWDSLRILFTTTGGIAGASSYSLHNQILDVYYVAGVLGVAVFAVLVGVLLRRALRTDPAAGLCLVTAAWIGILERPWSFTTIDWLSWSLIAMLMFVRPRPIDDVQTDNTLFEMPAERALAVVRA
jgi:hypothetical protein